MPAVLNSGSVFCLHLAPTVVSRLQFPPFRKMPHGEPELEPPPAKVLRKSVTKLESSSCEASAQPISLIDVLHIAPTLLDQSLCPSTLKPLLSTSRLLRRLVHEHVSSVTIRALSQDQLAELQPLTGGNWPCLQHLRILVSAYGARLETLTIKQVTGLNCSGLTSLNLSGNSLVAEGMSQLVLGKWPALKTLDLSHNNLDAAAMAQLTQAVWPLEELQLGSNTITVEAMEKLVQGNWPKLRRLSLSWNKLGADSMAVLVKAQWPLQYLDLRNNCLHKDRALAHLAQGRWPDLAKLVLAENNLRAKDIADLVQGKWPHLGTLDLTGQWPKCTLKPNDTAPICWAQWPRLVNLYMTCGRIPFTFYF